MSINTRKLVTTDDLQNHWWQYKEKTYMEDGALAWVQHTQSFVLARGQNPGAVPVPAGAVDQISVYAVDPHHRFPARHVPQDHHVITACQQNKPQRFGMLWESQSSVSEKIKWISGTTIKSCLAFSQSGMIHSSVAKPPRLMSWQFIDMMRYKMWHVLFCVHCREQQGLTQNPEERKTGVYSSLPQLGPVCSVY